MAIALAVRWWAQRFDPWVTGDGTEYIAYAESLAAGHGFQSYFPPGYPALIALARPLLRDRVAVAVAISVVCGALLCWPVWSLSRRALGARWALVPLAVVALHPALAKFSTLTMSESPYLLALYSGLALAASGQALGAGLAFGAAFAIRPEAMIPSLAVALGALCPRPGGPTPALRVRAALIGLAGFLVFAIPCWIWIHATWGHWSLTPKVSAIRAPYAPGQDEAIGFGGAAAPETDVGAMRMVRHLPEALASYPANAWVHLRALLQLWPWAWLLLSTWGLARRRGIESAPLFHLLALPLTGLSGQVRFVLVALPALAMSATAAARGSARPLKLAAAALALMGLAFHADDFRTQITSPFEGDWEAQRRAGEWLGGVSTPGDRVMDRKPYLAFYAHRPYWKIPLGSYEEILAAAARDHVRWFVVDEGVARVFRPQLLPLLFDPGFRNRETRLEAAYVGGRYEGHTVAVFRVLEPGAVRSNRPPRVELDWAKEGLDRLGP